MKTCPKCKKEKPLDQFGKHARNWNGHQSRCKECIRQDGRDRKGIGRVLRRRIWMEQNPGMSMCSKCKEGKPIQEFKKHKGQPHGIGSWCRSCHSASRIASYALNPSKEQESQKAWQQNNKHKRSYYLADYRCRKLRATPKWADMDSIQNIYERCAMITEWTGIIHHVDHHYPLRGRSVCGLHVETNLSIIPAISNLAKGNRIPKHDGIMIYG